MKARFCILLLSILIFTGSVHVIGAAENININGPLTVDMVIPIDKDQARDMLVAGKTWERAEITVKNTGNTTLSDVSILVKLPEYVEINIPTQPISINKTNQILTVTINDLKPHEQVSILMGIKPPGSIEYKKTVDFEIVTTWHSDEYSYTHQITIIPPPSWVTYITIIASLLIFIGIIIAVKHLGVLEIFTTVDLITIALIAALIAVVFRYLSKMVNLGWFDGLVITIPTVMLMIVALQLIRKPGTATLLFTVVLLISMVIWGSNLMWLGFYMAEGVIVDLLIFVFKMDYADRRSTAIIYGVTRSVTATLIFYMLFAPVEWKICYDMWYIYMQVGISCGGGIIGGYIGYDTAIKMSGAKL